MFTFAHGFLNGTETAESSALVILELNESSGTNAPDTSGNGNDGTLAGSADWDTNTDDGSSHSVLFGATTSDLIDLGTLDVENTGITLAAKIYSDYLITGQRIISKATGTDVAGHWWMLGNVESSGIKLRTRIKISGTTYTLIATSGTLSVDMWYHAAVTFDGTDVILYLDGTKVGTEEHIGSVDTSNTTSVAVGNQPSGAGTGVWEGNIDEVRIYDYALTSTEINALL